MLNVGALTLLLLASLSATLGTTRTVERPDIFIVHFPTGDAAVRAVDMPILDNVAAAWQQNRNAIVVISAHTDRVGTERFNRLLSLRRADGVRTYLRRRGVPARFIESHALGESLPAIATVDGVAEPRNRRVEIRFTLASP